MFKETRACPWPRVWTHADLVILRLLGQSVNQSATVPLNCINPLTLKHIQRGESEKGISASLVLFLYYTLRPFSLSPLDNSFAIYTTRINGSTTFYFNAFLYKFYIFCSSLYGFCAYFYMDLIQSFDNPN